MKIFIADLLKGWLYHLFICSEFIFTSNKKKWLFEHMDSLIVFIITFATIIFIILIEKTGSGVFYFIPNGKSYFDQRIGIPYY